MEKIFFTIIIISLISCDQKKEKTTCNCSIQNFEDISNGMSKNTIETKLLKTKAVKVEPLGDLDTYYTYKCEDSEDFITIKYETGYGNSYFKVDNKYFNDPELYKPLKK